MGQFISTRSQARGAKLRGFCVAVCQNIEVVSQEQSVQWTI
ncbi:hypothetical protein NWP26_16125 [Chrysosporum ovalisporum APH033B]|jgi:hypothetical protein|nr:hypothetical protein [Umezakia ovalisporum]MDH6068723.1 hypothetical protein [Umezakia ovalisporum APH033B]